MKQDDGTGRSAWFGCAAALWMLFGTMLLVAMTAWNGMPLPAGIPTDPLALAGFLVIASFVYLLPIGLLLAERRYCRERHERPGYAGFILCALLFAAIWTMLLLPSLLPEQPCPSPAPAATRCEGSRRTDRRQPARA
jgi:hypothetical protein